MYPRRSENQSLRGYTGIELAFFQHLPSHPLPILSSGAEAVGGVPELAVLYTRPCGVSAWALPYDAVEVAIRVISRTRGNVVRMGRLGSRLGGDLGMNG